MYTTVLPLEIGALLLLFAPHFSMELAPFFDLRYGVLELHPREAIDQVNSESRNTFCLTVWEDLNPFRLLGKDPIYVLPVHRRSLYNTRRAGMYHTAGHVILSFYLQGLEIVVRRDGRKMGPFPHPVAVEGLEPRDIAIEWITVMILLSLVLRLRLSLGKVGLLPSRLWVWAEHSLMGLIVAPRLARRLIFTMIAHCLVSELGIAIVIARSTCGLEFGAIPSAGIPSTKALLHYQLRYRLLGLWWVI